MKKVLFIAVLALPFFAAAQKNVELLAAAEETGSAMIYTLPKTALEVRVELKKTVQKAGPYAAYAQQYFGFEKAEIVGSDRTVYEISGIEIRRKGVPDPTRIFQITAASDSKAGLISLTDNGIIESVNAARAETAAKEYQKVDMPAKNAAVYFDKSDLTENYFLQNDANQKREVAASQIYQLRETQFNLLSAATQNEVSDANTLQLMLTELKRREDLLLELFKGKNITTTEYKTFEITPERAMKDRILFYFSPFNGVTSGVEGITDSYFISLRLSKKNGMPTVKNSRKNGFFHCIPLNAEVEIYNSERSLYKESIPMAQFGTLVSLPTDYVDKNNAAITFDTTTGAIKSIK
ncbi:MAG: DUF4831 family protein [Prevotellaceae bacterium]|jgi:hypothetical protein|nr:DUF4831 family protein [Prevotellaceae bacterium]